MAERILVNRWQPRSLTFCGVPIKLEFRSLSRAVALEYLKAMPTLLGPLVEDNATVEDRVAAAEKRVRELDGPFVRGLFEKYIRLPKGVTLQLDEEREITTALELFEESDANFLMACMWAFGAAQTVSDDEGNASGSRSSSSASAGQVGSDTNAMDTADAGSTEPSTATETSPASAPSIEAA
jgi:hypothetical protein